MPHTLCLNWHFPVYRNKLWRCSGNISIACRFLQSVLPQSTVNFRHSGHIHNGLWPRCVIVNQTLQEPFRPPSAGAISRSETQLQGGESASSRGTSVRSPFPSILEDIAVLTICPLLGTLSSYHGSCDMSSLTLRPYRSVTTL